MISGRVCAYPAPPARAFASLKRDDLAPRLALVCYIVKKQNRVPGGDRPWALCTPPTIRTGSQGRAQACLRLRAGRATATAGCCLFRGSGLAKLSHPNVVTVYDVGAFHDHVFIAPCSFVDGIRWCQLGARPGPPVDRVVNSSSSGRDWRRARQDLVHRDFKPENVMSSDEPHVRVIDFGFGLAAVRPLPTSVGDDGERASRDGDGDAHARRHCSGGRGPPW